MRRCRVTISNAVAALALICGATAAHPQGAIHKCVGADGKVSYQDSPCDTGKKAAGQIARDRTVPDPAALQRAEKDRQRVTQAAASRARQEAADAERRKQAEDAEARLKASRDAEEEAEARAAQAADPRYFYVPAPARINNPIVVPRSPARP